MLTADEGEPRAVRVLEGNTADPSPVASPITRWKEQFGIAEGVRVGDRGMIQAKGTAALSAEGGRYITALTDAPVRTLLQQGVWPPDWFDAHLGEGEHDGQRLIVRRNEAVRGREERRRADPRPPRQEKIAARNAIVAKSPPPARRKAWRPCRVGSRATSSVKW